MTSTVLYVDMKGCIAAGMSLALFMFQGGDSSIGFCLEYSPYTMHP